MRRNRILKRDGETVSDTQLFTANTCVFSAALSRLSPTYIGRNLDAVRLIACNHLAFAALNGV
jgi:hypothetical protein